jgi:Dna[CI] antecedent DciA-like protein
MDLRMESLRGTLGAGLLQRIEKELGQEATLQLLWPHMVGARLAANTRLKAVRGCALIVAVPDRGWRRSLGSLDGMILEAVNRWAGVRNFNAVELVEDPQMPLPAKTARPAPRRRLPELDFDITMISDPALRDAFASSAKKYFARRSRGVALDESENPNPKPKTMELHQGRED